MATVYSQYLFTGLVVHLKSVSSSSIYPEDMTDTTTGINKSLGDVGLYFNYSVNKKDPDSIVEFYGRGGVVTQKQTEDALLKVDCSMAKSKKGFRWCGSYDKQQALEAKKIRKDSIQMGVIEICTHDCPSSVDEPIYQMFVEYQVVLKGVGQVNGVEHSAIFKTTGRTITHDNIFGLTSGESTGVIATNSKKEYQSGGALPISGSLDCFVALWDGSRNIIYLPRNSFGKSFLITIFMEYETVTGAWRS